MLEWCALVTPILHHGYSTLAPVDLNSNEDTRYFYEPSQAPSGDPTGLSPTGAPTPTPSSMPPTPTPPSTPGVCTDSSGNIYDAMQIGGTGSPNECANSCSDTLPQINANRVGVDHHEIDGCFCLYEDTFLDSVPCPIGATCNLYQSGTGPVAGVIGINGFRCQINGDFLS